MQRLRFVSELPERYHHVFQEFTTFNFIQSALMDFLINTDISVVVSAPTGSGKTTLFEIAIIKLLEMWEHSEEDDKEQKIVYMAPIKALCTEKFKEWDNKFTSLGIRAVEITGDSDSSDLLTIQHFNLILTTPEKWDALTRKWKDHTSLIQMIKLFLIDEVHLLNEERRGPTLEAVVSRMKTVQESLDYNETGDDWIRFIAVSATIPNIEDIAAWLSLKPKAAKFFKFGEEMRPVHLKRIVKAYPCKDERTIGYKFDLSLNYKLKQIIMQYSEGKPTLIFCSTRKSVLMTANVLCEQISFHFTSDQLANIVSVSECLLENKLKEMVKRGIAYHHAGLVVSDRHYIEELFRSGYLPVLVSTSTLAMGVNLPANLVIIKSTEQYVCGGWQEYSEGQILQMVGRAGRPQFGNSAAAIILTKDVNKEKYEKLVHGQELIESTLHRHLVEHLNAEIVLGTITDIAVAMNWIKSTYLYVRALKNPKHYGIPAGLSSKEVEARLQDMCLRELHALENYHLIITTEMAYNVEPTESGKLMAKYYIAFETMKIFMKVKGTENLSEMLELLAQCHEFEDIQLRRNEKSALNLMNSHKEQEFIRFPLQGKVKTRQMKTNCLIQSVLGTLQISDISLKQETVKIMRLAQRLLNGLSFFLWQKNFYQALASTLILNKCVHARLWENSPYVSRQLPGIGPTLASLLVSAKKTTFQAILESNPRDLERIINRKPPMGNQLLEAAAKIPQYEVEVSYSSSDKKITIILKILNAFEVQYGNTLHRCSLLVADNNNILLKKEKICDQAILAHCGEFQFSVLIRYQENCNEFIVHLISDSLVGIDVKHTYKIIGGAAVKQQSICQPKNNEGPFKELKSNKASSRGNATKTSNVSNKRTAKENKAIKKQIQCSLEQYSFIPKRGKILHQSSNNSTLNEENEVTSTQDVHRSHYFSCDYAPTHEMNTELAVTQQSELLFDNNSFSSVAMMNDDVTISDYDDEGWTDLGISSFNGCVMSGNSTKHVDLPCTNIAQTKGESYYEVVDSDSEGWTDSGISSFNRSMNRAKQEDPVNKNITQAKSEPQPNYNGTSNVKGSELKEESGRLFQRKPITLSPNSTFNDQVEVTEGEKTANYKKCFYPLFMPFGSEAGEHFIENSSDETTLGRVEKNQGFTECNYQQKIISEICNEGNANIEKNMENRNVENRETHNKNANKVDLSLSQRNQEKMTKESEHITGEIQEVSGIVIGNNDLKEQSIDKAENSDELFNEDLLLNIDLELSLGDISSDEIDVEEVKNKDNTSNEVGKVSLKDKTFQNDESSSLNEKTCDKNNEIKLETQSFDGIPSEIEKQDQFGVNYEANSNFEELQLNSKFSCNIDSKPRSEIELPDKFSRSSNLNCSNNLKKENKAIQEVRMHSSQNLGFDVDELLYQSPKDEGKEKISSSLSSVPNKEELFQLENNELAHDDHLNLINPHNVKKTDILKRKPLFKNERSKIPYQFGNDDIRMRKADRMKMVSNKENLLPINNYRSARRYFESGTYIINNKIYGQAFGNESLVHHSQATGTSMELNDDERDVDRVGDQNYLRDGYGDPFAPIYPSSALNKMTEEENNVEQTNRRNKTPSLLMYNEFGLSSRRCFEMQESDVNRSRSSQSFIRETGPDTAVHSFGTPSWPLATSSSVPNWATNVPCRKPLSSVNNCSSSQQSLHNLRNANVNVERQYSPCKSQKSYGEHLFIENQSNNQNLVFSQKANISQIKLPTFQPYFRKYRPRYDARWKNFRKFSVGTSSSVSNRAPYVDIQQGTRNSTVLQKAGNLSQRNTVVVESQDYSRRRFHSQQDLQPCGSVLGEPSERSRYPLFRKKITNRQPNQMSYSHPSQMYSSFDNAISQSNSLRGTMSMFGTSEKENLGQFQFTNDIENSPKAEEYLPTFESITGNLGFPVTHNIHEMSPSPPLSGDEFQDATVEERYTPRGSTNFEDFCFSKENSFF